MILWFFFFENLDNLLWICKRMSAKYWHKICTLYHKITDFNHPGMGTWVRWLKSKSQKNVLELGMSITLESETTDSQTQDSALISHTCRPEPVCISVLLLTFFMAWKTLWGTYSDQSINREVPARSQRRVNILILHKTGEGDRIQLSCLSRKESIIIGQRFILGQVRQEGRGKGGGDAS